MYYVNQYIFIILYDFPLCYSIRLYVTLQAGRVAADRKPTKLATKLVRGFVGTH